MNKNLNFVPEPGKYNKNNFHKDKTTFYRSTILKAHFGNDNDYKPTGLKSKSNKQWIPNNIHHTVKTFIEAVNTDLETEMNTEQKKQRSNLSRNERMALQTLMHREDIIITQADKGGAVCIISIEDYIKEAKRQLDDTNFYTRMPTDLTSTHAEVINNTIRQFAKDKLLPMQVAKTLITEDPKTARFYYLPKVHKINYPSERTDVPGRPIISSINSPSSSIAHFVDHHLQPITLKLKSYIKDTTDFLNKLETIGTLPKGSILVTMDVKSLFTNIPHSEGINAVANALEAEEESNISTRVIIKFLSLILNLNNFTFNDENVLQIKGCTMGAKSSPSYANIFMGKFEEDNIYPLLTDNIVCYFRFIDDIFFIWTGSEELLHQVITKVNEVHNSIKFDYKYSYKEIDFLDTTVIINNDLTISTKLYVKPTDRNAYLQYSSYHPRSMKENIPYGQALRVKKICTNKDDLESSMETLKNNFINRGYPQDKIDKDIERAKSVERQELLRKSNKKREGNLCFCTTYNRNLPNIRGIINNNWHLLHVNKEISTTFNNTPILAFRRNRNLKQLIGQHHLSRNKKLSSNKRKSGGSQPCLSQVGNICCKQLVSTNKFQSHKTKSSYTIRHHMNCNSKNVIYLAECILCPNTQYVGKTEPPWKRRLYGHRSDSKKADAIEFDQHFQLPGHNFSEHARFTLIEKMNTGPPKGQTHTQRLENREDFWMLQLKTIKPDGLNVGLNSATSNQIRVICS